MTTKLYNADSYCREFTAKVLSCTPEKGGFAVLLDRTAFFPEEGGQGADHGTLGGAAVTDVCLRDGELYHITDRELTPGETVTGTLDWDRRFRHMQHHTGEHILSGTLHRLFGTENVGFHLYDEVTLDTDIALSDEQIDRAEEEANAAVFADIPVEILYPSPAELQTMTYRSKLALTENVRIVRIPGVDVCACCAPHVARTGEVGLIRVVDHMNYKGGTRIFIRCGHDALLDARTRQNVLGAIGRKLSAHWDRADDAVFRLFDELEAEKAYAAGLEEELREFRVAALLETDGILALFYPGLNALSLRRYAEAASKKCTVAAVFTPDGAGGHRYALLSEKCDVRQTDRLLHEALGGKGGGKSDLTQGSLPAGEEEIRRVLFG